MSAVAHDIVLSSGWLAFASHCGVLAALEDSGVPVDGVVGTSSGALCGALWAAGLSAREVLDVLTASRPVAWVRPHLQVWRGAFDLRAMVREVRRYVPATFAELPRPVGVGVIRSDRSHALLTDGPLPEAVAASCAVPRLFAPVAVAGTRFADGGATDRLGLVAWRAHRPATRPLVHLVDRTAGSPVEQGLENAVVVRSPRSGAQLWSLGDVEARFGAARSRAHAVLSELG